MKGRGRGERGGYEWRKQVEGWDGGAIGAVIGKAWGKLPSTYGGNEVACAS